MLSIARHTPSCLPVSAGSGQPSPRIAIEPLLSTRVIAPRCTFISLLAEAARDLSPPEITCSRRSSTRRIHQGGFYHVGRFQTLDAVVDHYDRHFKLTLTAAQKRELIEDLKSL